MKRPSKQFALCLENEGNEASLILGKVYRILPDARAGADDLVRIVDESGDDYLFDIAQFAFVEFPQRCGRTFSLFRKPANTSGPGGGREANTLIRGD